MKRQRMARVGFAVALASALPLAAIGCQHPAEFFFTGDGTPIAVNATAPLKLGYEPCGHETLLPYNLCVGNDVRDVIAVSIADPAILEVVDRWQVDSVLVRALAAGQTAVTIEFVDANGERQTHVATISARAADTVELTSACLGGRSDQPVALPAGTQIEFFLVLKAGETRLAGYGYVPLDPGALTLRDALTAYDPARALQQIVLEMPAAATATEIHSDVDARLAFGVDVYGETAVDGLQLLPLAAGPYPVAMDYKGYLDIDVAIAAHGRPVCAYDNSRWPVTVTVDTPAICSLISAPTASPRLVVKTMQAGTCHISAQLDGTAFTTELELQFIDP